MKELSGIDVGSLRVVKYPDPVLSLPAKAVERFDDALRALAEGMFKVMYDARGVGLAAPQVGVSIRLFVANPEASPGEGEAAYVNPEIVGPDGSVVHEEGCLSVPGINCRVKRFATLTLRALDLDGQAVEVPAEGLAARIFQHEIDHLNGVLLINRMSAVARMASRRVIKELEEAYAGEGEEAS